MSESSSFFDLSLLYTLGLIFLATLIGTFLKARRKDPCLRSFEGFHVTLERADNKLVWGVLELESTGFELRYRDDVQDEKHLESSYILYGKEFGEIQALFRFADELTPENRRRREKEIRRSFHPGLWERSKRSFRRLIGTTSDSINEMISVLVGHARKPAGRYISEKGETYLNQLGTNLVGHVGGIYDPLLERYIGHKVVVEVLEDDEVHEHVGIFKNYSPDFLEILDVHFPHKRAVELGPQGCTGEDCVEAHVDGNRLVVSNPGEQPVLISTLELDDVSQSINALVDAGEEIELFPDVTFERAELHVRIVRELDMILPRTRGLIRHRAERFESNILPDIVFDVGTIFQRDERKERWEKQYREELERNPNAAPAAANLGGLLLQRGEFDEAERWLRKALRTPYSLPDNGRRAQMQLRELLRKRDKSSLRQPKWRRPDSPAAPARESEPQPAEESHTPVIVEVETESESSYQVTEKETV